MSRIRANLITNRMANGAPTVSNGLVISGVTTTSDVNVGQGVTFSTVGNATFSGIVTATSFVGSGANLTGITGGGALSSRRLNINGSFLVWQRFRGAVTSIAVTDGSNEGFLRL